MKALGMSDEEIADVLRTDKEIDRGAKLFELDPELEAGAKKARRANRKPTEAKRERKEDTDKRQLITLLTSAIGNVQPEDIINPEREFLFTWNGKKYKVTLSCPRS